MKALCSRTEGKIRPYFFTELLLKEDYFIVKSQLCVDFRFSLNASVKLEKVRTLLSAER